MTPSAAQNSVLHCPVSLSGPAEYSRFVQRVRRRYAAYLSFLPVQTLDKAVLTACLGQLRGQGLDLGTSLRILRQLVMERLVCQDTEQNCPLSEVTHAMTHLAEVALDAACCAVFEELDAKHGSARTPTGAKAQFMVVGMGKLGARELNVSSDIDLIYVYDYDGQTEGLELGRGQLSNQEYYAKAVKGIHTLIGEVTEHGFVFRLDLALRPHGNSGPAAISLDALQEYFHVLGREWERFAWLKSRIVAPQTVYSTAGPMQLRSVVLPFVFRRYLDYDVFDALRGLHKQIRQQAMQRAAGRPERANDVKLSRGGIREIEFIVQLLQVVRGGQYPELRTRATLEALPRLQAAGLMQAASASALAEAYVFLRRTEHRIQYLDDQQTHLLPTREDDLDWLARTLGYSGTAPFLADLDAHRERVAQEFEALLSQPNPNRKEGCCGKASTTATTSPEQDLTNALQAIADQLPEQHQVTLQAFGQMPKLRLLREQALCRLARLMRRSAQWLQTEDGHTLPLEQRQSAVVRWLDWTETLLRRDSYLALLEERPAIQIRLLRLLGSARWASQYLRRHPGVIDELADDRMLAGRFDADALRAELRLRRQALQTTNEDDDESLLNILRRAHHAEVFRTLARDVEGHLSVEQVADDLSALADTVLHITCDWCWERSTLRHRDDPHFAIIGYGKLGGKELGYGSDLDIVFVYDDEDEQAGQIYAGLVRKLINWLSVKTAEGDLFEIDTALRPNGNSGLLVTSFAAYAAYQQQRGSNTAWTWEHQAMTRARCVLGPMHLAQRFAAVRETVLCAAREPVALRTEILAMRDKLRAAHPSKTALFDLKYGVGGLIDAEFAVQYLVLAHAAQHPALRDNVGNIALLERAEQCALLAPGLGTAAANAYRRLRQLQHLARLDGLASEVHPELVAAETAAVVRMTTAVLGSLG